MCAGFGEAGGVVVLIEDTTDLALGEANRLSDSGLGEALLFEIQDESIASAAGIRLVRYERMNAIWGALKLADGKSPTEWLRALGERVPKHNRGVV